MAAWQYHPLLVVFQLGGLLSLGIALYCLHYVRTRGRSYLVASVGLLAFHNAVWVFAAALKVASLDLGTKLLLYKLEYLGSATNPSISVVLALAYVGRENWLTRETLGVLAVIPAVMIPLILINPAEVMIANPHLVQVGDIVTLEHAFPPLFTLFLAWALGATLLSGVYIAYGAVVGAVRRSPAVLVSLTLLLPVVVVSLKVSGIYPPNGVGINVTPAANALSLGLLAVAITRYRLFDLLPAGRKRAIDVMRDGYVLVDADGVVVDANPAATGLLGGVENRPVVGRTIGETVPALADLDAVGESRTFTTAGRVIQATCSDLHRQCQIVGRVLVLRDITGRKEREHELEQYERIIENVPIGVYRTTPGVDGEFVFANEALVDILGATSKADLQSRSPSEFYLEDGGREEFVDHLLQSGVVTNEERRMRRVDGETIWASINDRTVQEDGELYFEGAIQDITERKEYERRLERQMSQLEVLNRIVRHDINNDMTVVLGMVRSVQDSVDDSTVQERLERAASASESVVELTQTARNLMKTMLNEQQEPEPVGLSRVVEAEVSNVRSAYDDAEVRIDGSIPRVTVLADELLGSVFRNLLKNAVEHNDKAVPVVTVSADETADAVRVHVADNGPGIPAELRETVFGKERKGLDSDGTGIGLYLVRSLLDGYGGEVRIEDNDPSGTVFTVVLRRP